MLTSPAFLYKLEEPAAGARPGLLNNHELATRLSFFLWSSVPDGELRSHADAARLTAGQQLHYAADSDALQLATNETLLRQTRRTLGHRHTRRLAVQFACQWLHVRDFDKNDDKNEALYPEFADLREKCMKRP